MSVRDERLSVRARITVTVEVDCHSNWGPDCTMDQIHKQAIEDGLGYIRNATERDRRLTIIGKPTVVMSTLVVKP